MGRANESYLEKREQYISITTQPGMNERIGDVTGEGISPRE